MMRFTAVLLGLALVAAFGVQAQEIDLALQHTDIEDLSPEARAAYDDAVDAYDHADHIGAVNSLAQAAELAPDNVEMQVLFIDVARKHVRLRNMSWDEGMAMAERGLAAYERILTYPELREWAFDLIEEEYFHLSDLIANAEELYAQKLEAGFEIAQQRAEAQARLDALREQQEAQLRNARAVREWFGLGDPGAPHPLFQEAAEARRGSSREGVQSVGRGHLPSTREGVESVQ